MNGNKELENELKKGTIFDPELTNIQEEVKNISPTDFERVKENFDNMLKYLQENDVRRWNFFGVFMPIDILYYHIYYVILITNLRKKLEERGIRVMNYIYVPDDVVMGHENVPLQKVWKNIEIFKKILNFFGWRNEGRDRNFEIIRYFDIQRDFENYEFYKHRREIEVNKLIDFYQKIDKSEIYGERRIYYDTVMDVLSYYNESYISYKYMKNIGTEIHFMIISIDRLFMYNYFLELIRGNETETPPAIYPISPLPLIRDEENKIYLNLNMSSQTVKDLVNSKLTSDDEKILEYLFINPYLDIFSIPHDDKKIGKTTGEKISEIWREIRKEVGLGKSQQFQQMTLQQAKDLMGFLRNKYVMEIIQIIYRYGGVEGITNSEIREKYNSKYGGNISESQVSNIITQLRDDWEIITSTTNPQSSERRKIYSRLNHGTVKLVEDILKIEIL